MQTITPNIPENSAVLPFLPVDQANESATEKKTVRVLHLINGEHYAGAERVQDLLGLRLPEFGFEPGFACLKPKQFPQRRNCRNAPLIEAPMRFRGDLSVVGKLARIVQQENYQILHAHTPRTALLGRLVAWRTRRPLVYHVHSPTSRDSTRPLANSINTVVERWGIAGAKKLIAVSHSLGRHMREQGYGERVTVVPNGVPAIENTKPRRKPKEHWVLGCVALFRPRKGLEVLLEALAKMRNEGRNILLRAVGPFETPEYETSIHQLCQKLKLQDAILWRGFTDNVPQELAEMDLFVLPSLFGEGLPMVILEAMAAGTPVVATKVEGVPEAIRHGIDGLLCNPNDPGDLARSIERVVAGDANWSALRESALLRHREHFSDLAMARGVADVYRQVLENC